MYSNEREVGEALETVRAGGVKREELWITSKLWNDKHAEEDVIASCRKSLEDLRLDYLDLYLVHWPFPNFHPPGCDVTSRSADAKPYIHENYMKTWRKMEELVDLGLVRHIGTSNMTIPKLKLVLRDARIKPAVNEMELHPHFQQPELFRFVVENGIAAHWVLPDRIAGTAGARPDAGGHGADGRPGGCKDRRAAWGASGGGLHQVGGAAGADADSLLRDAAQLCGEPAGGGARSLSDEEMREIAGIDRNCRLIKGQVFLWKDGQSWEDLWDVNGEITPA